MVLLIGLYVDPDAARLGEFLTCLERNVTNRAIDEVHVFVEDEINPVDLAGSYWLLRSRKVRLVVTGEWTYSSSLRRPKYHLQRYPVTFGDPIVVDTIALDSFRREAGLTAIDFIWADVEGAEGDMVRGGLESLRRTRYLYTAYSDDESYEGQATLRDLPALLPDFRVIELWPEQVLLENRAITSTP